MLRTRAGPGPAVASPGPNPGPEGWPAGAGPGPAVAGAVRGRWAGVAAAGSAPPPDPAGRRPPARWAADASPAVGRRNRAGSCGPRGRVRHGGAGRPGWFAAAARSGRTGPLRDCDPAGLVRCGDSARPGRSAAAAARRHGAARWHAADRPVARQATGPAMPAPSPAEQGLPCPGPVACRGGQPLPAPHRLSGDGCPALPHLRHPPPDLALLGEPARLRLVEDLPIPGGDDEPAARRGDQRHRGHAIRVRGEDLFRHTGGSRQVPSRRAVLDAHRDAFVHRRPPSPSRGSDRGRAATTARRRCAVSRDLAAGRFGPRPGPCPTRPRGSGLPLGRRDPGRAVRRPARAAPRLLARGCPHRTGHRGSHGTPGPGRAHRVQQARPPRSRSMPYSTTSRGSGGMDRSEGGLRGCACRRLRRSGPPPPRRCGSARRGSG